MYAYHAMTAYVKELYIINNCIINVNILPKWLWSDKKKKKKNLVFKQNYFEIEIKHQWKTNQRSFHRLRK